MSPMSPLPPVDRRTFIRSLAGVGGAALATAYALPAWAESLGGDVALLGPWSDQIGLQLFTVRAIDDPHSDWSSPRPAWLVFGADHGAILPPHLAAAGPRANWQARKKRIDRRNPTGVAVLSSVQFQTSDIRLFPAVRGVRQLLTCRS